MDLKDLQEGFLQKSYKKTNCRRISILPILSKDLRSNL